jgi:hypothetical protein
VSPQLRAARNDTRIMGDHLRAAWERWVAAECAARPLLMVLDDLHWADLPSIKLIDAVLRRLRDRPLMVIALARPEVHERFAGLWSEREVQEIRLAGLTRRASQRLIKEVLGDDVAEDLLAMLVERADGNAFFLEELIRAAQNGDVAAAPEPVLALLQARLEKLDPEARRVLRAASIFGNRFRADGAAALLGGAVPVQPWLDTLAEKEVVERDEDASGEAAYLFRHGLVREVAYGALTERDRAVGHRLAGAWLLARGERAASVLAEHFERGGEPARAAWAFRAAAEQALQGADLEGCLRFTERGAACGADGTLLGELRAVGASALAWLGRCREAAVWAGEALDLLTPANPSWHVATVCATLYFLGQRDLAHAFVDRMERLDLEAVARDPAAANWIDHARLYRAIYEEQDPWQALHFVRRMAERLDEVGDRRWDYPRRGLRAELLLALGAFDEGVTVAVEALAAAERDNALVIANWLRTILGELWLRAGAEREARSTLTAGLCGADAVGDLTCRGHCLALLARADLAAGDLATGRRNSEEAADLLSGCLTLRAPLLATSARLRLGAGDHRGALADALEARALLRASGATPPDAAWVELAHAEVLEAGGDVAGARAALAASAARLRALAATIDDPAVRATFLDRVEEHARILALAGRTPPAPPRPRTAALLVEA